jgi:hypothetical protein
MDLDRPHYTLQDAKPESQCDIKSITNLLRIDHTSRLKPLQRQSRTSNEHVHNSNKKYGLPHILILPKDNQGVEQSTITDSSI